ncbi:hypothetical protein [Alkalihalophilus marmarensis]|uniref:hypothetical protein n=1 Tax=Alkalihalophilus marmarensis TaxID=521377 RepID=UPI002E24DA8F|nr:hypothetical protein [Alkalihalophilus marmarensis]
MYKPVNNVDMSENYMKRLVVMAQKVGLLILIICLFIHIPVSAKNEQTLIIVVAPDLAFEDVKRILETEENKELWKEAAIGALNIKPDGPYSYLNSMVSIGSGRRAVGVQDWNSYESNEQTEFNVTARDLEIQLTGQASSSSLSHPHFHRLVSKNDKSSYQPRVGILGDKLKEAGINRFVLGQSDTIIEKIRYGSLLVIDSQGVVEGDYKQSVKKSPASPAGKEMDEAYLLSELQDRNGLIVIEWGDLHRLYEQRPLMMDSHFNNERDRQLTRLGMFIEQLRQQDQNGHTVWLLSPMMNKEAYDQKQQLAPLLIWDKEDGGYLTSNTTNQHYLVSNLDIAPSILAHFGLNDPRELPGHSMQRMNVGEEDKQKVLDHVDELTLIYQSRASVLSAYITTLVILLIVAGVLSFFRKPQIMGQNVLKMIILSALLSPIPFLIGSKLLIHIGITAFVFFVVIFSLGCGYVISRFKRNAIAIVGGMLFVLISLDLLLGTPFMQRSYLGYDPIIGARYYGIGNEYAGIYIISGLALLSGFQSVKEKMSVMMVVALGAIQLILLGHSELGTNAGATLAAGIAYFFLLFRLLQFKWTLLRTILVGAASLLLLFSFLFVLQLTGNQTHIGAGFNRLFAGDLSYLFHTIERKVSMNWKIFRHSNWTQLFVTSYLVVMVMLIRKTLQKSHQLHALILQTGICASVALLILNDSGVVAAATSMFCVVCMHYYWLLEQKEKRGA